MSVIFLDAGPLSKASNPKSSSENDACRQWLMQQVSQGTRVVIPEIADYEVRRELLRADKASGIQRLDILKSSLEILPISSPAMLLAADLWARMRRTGMQTASDASLDGDVILAAQALTCGVASADIAVATTNVGHLARMVTAKDWRNM